MANFAFLDFWKQHTKKCIGSIFRSNLRLPLGINYITEKYSILLGIFSLTCIQLCWKHFLFNVIYVHNPDPTAWPLAILHIFTWQRNMRIKEGKCYKSKRNKKKYIKRGNSLNKLFKWHSNSVMIFSIFLKALEIYKATQMRRSKL